MKKSRAIEERVLKTAQNFISCHGVKGWNMDSLANASGICKRTLYKTVTSKEQLIRDICIKAVIDIQNRFIEINKPEKDFMEAFEEMLQIVPDLLKNNYIFNFNEILHEYPSLEPEFIKENNKLFNNVRVFLQSGINNGYLRDDISPTFLHQMFQAFVLYFMKYSTPQSESSVNIDHALHYLLEGIKK